MNDPFSVESLLEEAEREANAKVARETRGNRTTIDASRDPRLRRTSVQDSAEPREAPATQSTSKDAKRSSSDDNRYSVEREENDQRRSRRSRDLDEELKESSDRASANGSVRSRRRSRSPVRSRRDSRDRDSYRARDYNRYAHVRDVRDRDRPGSGDYYNGTGRPSAYDDDRYRPGRDRSPPRRDRDRPPRGGRDQHRSHEPRRAKTPEPTDDERDRRTVFVQQLAARLRTKELKSFFEQVGPVVEAQIVKDRVSQRSKGYIYSICYSGHVC
jgi:RNA-binding protein 39